MQDLGYIITISFGRCFGLVAPKQPHHHYDCDSDYEPEAEAWSEGRKLCVDKIQNG